MSLLGTSWEDPRTAAIMGLAGGLLQGNAGAGLQQGLLGYQRQSQISNQTARQQKYDAREDEEFGIRKQALQAQSDAAKAKAFDEQRVRELLPKLAAGEIDAPTAIAAGVPDALVKAIKESGNYGRAKGTRQIEVDDGKGGKRIALVDDYGQEVAGYAGYVAPVQVNTGNSIMFTKPTAGQSFAVGMSPAERDASAARWQRLELDLGAAVADAGGPNQLALTKQFGKAPPNYRWRPDGTAEAIPGGPADIKAGEQGAKLEAKTQSALAQGQNVLGTINDARNLVGWNTAGVGSVLSGVPATDARDLQAKLETVKANLGFDRLQQMRDQSPTGGALGAVAVQELTALQSTVASLDQAQSPTQLKAALDKIERHYRGWMDAVRKAKGVSAPARPAPGSLGSGSYGATSAPRTPMRGQVVDGYKFKGGNPADPASWEKQ